MKKLLLTALSALAIGLLPAGAQWGPREIPEPTDGLKDAYKDYFKIGVAVNNHNVVNPGEVAVVLREFNSITAENAMKPEPTEPQKGVFRWEDADRIADFCRAHKIPLRGHTLMWHSQIAPWMYQDKDGNLLSKEEFYANMKHHIQAVVNRYKDIVSSNPRITPAPQTPYTCPMKSPYLRQRHQTPVPHMSHTCAGRWRGGRPSLPPHPERRTVFE